MSSTRTETFLVAAPIANNNAISNEWIHTAIISIAFATLILLPTYPAGSNYISMGNQGDINMQFAYDNDVAVINFGGNYSIELGNPSQTSYNQEFFFADSGIVVPIECRPIGRNVTIPIIFHRQMYSLSSLTFFQIPIPGQLIISPEGQIYLSFAMTPSSQWGSITGTNVISIQNTSHAYAISATPLQ